MDRRFFVSASMASLMSGAALRSGVVRAATAGGTATKGVFFMNRIAPSSSNLFIAGLDGSGERKLLADAHPQEQPVKIRKLTLAIAALGLATGVVRAEAGLLVSFLDADREASDWVVFDFAPALAPLRDDLAVEGILRYSLCHPALETGRAAAHPAVNGSETLARTSCARRPQGPIRRPGCKFRKKDHGLWREAWPKPGK